MTDTDTRHRQINDRLIEIVRQTAGLQAQMDALRIATHSMQNPWEYQALNAQHVELMTERSQLETEKRRLLDTGYQSIVSHFEQQDERRRAEDERVARELAKGPLSEEERQLEEAERLGFSESTITSLTLPAGLARAERERAIRGKSTRDIRRGR